VAFTAPRARFDVPLPGRAPLQLGAATLVMGVLNVTPDSFSDGGSAVDPQRAVERGLAMEAEGADLLDVGGESTRPGADAVDAAEEWRRVQPVLAGLTKRLRIPISIDTYRADTAARALDAGAGMVNDISGLEYDSGLGAVIATRGGALVLMHTRGRSRAMYQEAHYDDVVQEVARELAQRIDRAIDAGIARERIVIDPGLGFAKHAPHSMTALARLDELARLDRPILAGPSRKSFLTSATGPLAPRDRDWATAAAVTVSVLAGAHIVRVHRVAEMAQVARVADAIRRSASAEPR
jgi:dihydropteroate synthase